MLTQGSIAVGAFVGGGADKTIQLGYVPDFVVVTNARGSTETVTLSQVYQVLKFDSGSEQLYPGDNIIEETNGGTATVVDVAVTSGAWADGDAAGMLFLVDVVGTIANDQTLGIVAKDQRGPVTNAATADGAPATTDVDIDTEVGTPATDTARVKPYLGTAGANNAGFIIDALTAVNTELVTWVAFRADHRVWG